MYVVKRNYDIVVFNYTPFPVYTRTTGMTHFQDVTELKIWNLVYSIDMYSNRLWLISDVQAQSLHISASKYPYSSQLQALNMFILSTLNLT